MRDACCQEPTANIKDGLSEPSKENEIAYSEMEKMSSVLPTMWLGSHPAIAADVESQHFALGRKLKGLAIPHAREASALDDQLESPGRCEPSAGSETGEPRGS